MERLEEMNIDDMYLGEVFRRPFDSHSYMRLRGSGVDTFCERGNCVPCLDRTTGFVTYINRDERAESIGIFERV